MQDFCNELATYRNRDELVSMLRARSNDRGFKINLPYGLKSVSVYISCSHYRAPRINCPE